MAAGSVSFLVYTGSRSGLMAVLVVAIVLVTKYDIVLKKHFISGYYMVQHLHYAYVSCYRLYMAVFVIYRQ